MRVGVDSYSYHRLLGEVRQGELPSAVAPFARGSLDVLAAVRASGAELASLETVFLPPPGRLDVVELRAAAGPLELALAWGHPDGLAWGTDAAGLSELRAWIRLAPRLGCRLVRCVAASPRLRRTGTPDEQLNATARAVRRALVEAEAAGVALAIENHGDLTAAMLGELLDRCPGLGVCFDTANALRVGDDPVTAAAQLAERVLMVHLKDCEPLDASGAAVAADAADASGAAGVSGTCGASGAAGASGASRAAGSLAGSPRPVRSLAGPRSVPYGDGVVPLDAVLRTLAPALAAGAPVCVELAQLGPEVADERAMVADGVAWLRRWRGSGRLGPVEGPERPVVEIGRAEGGAGPVGGRRPAEQAKRGPA